MRDDFPAKTINTLFRRAGSLCSNPDCRKPTVGSHENEDKFTIVGVAAHITAAAKGGPRYDESMTPSLRSSTSNGIWLCPSCSTLIDKDPGKFPPELLREWKADVEKESSDRLQNKVVKPRAIAIIKPSIQERAAQNKAIREKELERNTFMRSDKAIVEARNQVKILIEKLQQMKKDIEDPSTGFNITHEGNRDNVYAIGRHPIYVNFNWFRPHEWDVNEAMLKAHLYEKTGIWNFDRDDKIIKYRDYKYSRNIEGVDGWVDFKTGENFISTQDLFDLWIEEFFQYIGYSE